MKVIKKILPYIFSICFIYFVFVLSFYIILYSDENFLINLFNKFNVFENLPFNISAEDTKKIATELMDYLRGKINFLDTKIFINDKLTDVYSIKAKIHMGDVRTIFLNNIKFAYISFAISLCSLIFSIKHNISIKALYKSYKNILIIVCIIFAIIVIYAGVNFDSFFMLFHRLLFTNDYFLFDPRTDFIILMLPEKLFMTIGLHFVILFIILLSLVFFILYFLAKTQQSQEAKLHL